MAENDEYEGDVGTELAIIYGSVAVFFIVGFAILCCWSKRFRNSIKHCRLRNERAANYTGRNNAYAEDNKPVQEGTVIIDPVQAVAVAEAVV